MSVTTTMYTPDTDNLDKVASCDIFGFLMATAGVTKDTDYLDIVEKLYELKNRSTTFSSYILTILDNIIGYGNIEDYTEHLTDTPNEFITSEGELVSVSDLSWI